MKNTITLTESQFQNLIKEAVSMIVENEYYERFPDYEEDKNWHVGENVVDNYNGVEGLRRYEYDSGEIHKVVFKFPTKLHISSIWGMVEKDMDEEGMQFCSLDNDGEMMALEYESKGKKNDNRAIVKCVKACDNKFNSHYYLVVSETGEDKDVIDILTDKYPDLGIVKIYDVNGDIDLNVKTKGQTELVDNVVMEVPKQIKNIEEIG